MLDTELQEKEQSSASKIDILVAGLTGFLAGAAGITILALSDKDIRKKAFERAKEAETLLKEWHLNKLQTSDDRDEIVEENKNKTEEEMHSHMHN